MAPQPTLTPPPFTRVLVANRGEIAIRVFRALRELGIESVAVYSDADRYSLHVEAADEAYYVGAPTPADSYLNVDRILDVAERAQVEAIHPGYGFLAENAQFARACSDRGLIFIGPTPDAIDAMGSKTASRELMRAAGVAIVPGTTEAAATYEVALAEAQAMGFPVAVKARSGGGGKGFRVALTEKELQSAYDGASREGERYFSDPAVYLEKYVSDPRHIEVQVLGDHHGNLIHLGERDCSIQRRHQKLVEECPAPGMTPELRSRLGELALGAARAVNYTSAGTIECLLDADGTPYFLEMNTRVQVEHTVTEMATGVDIVAEQIRIAAGSKLSIAQEDVTLRGHAIEVRINAEDAWNDFMPSSGYIRKWNEPSGPGVRVDSGYATGSTVPSNYDTLLAKLIVHAHDRDAAVARLRRALGEFYIEGITTLIPFFEQLSTRVEFVQAETCRDIVSDVHGTLGEGPTDPIVHSSPIVGVEQPGRKPELFVVEVDDRSFSVAVSDPRVGRPIAPTVRARMSMSAGGTGDVVAPIPGNVLSITVAMGDSVEAGQIVAVLEAMKMENEIGAPCDGVVEKVAAISGTAVSAGELLLHIAPSS